MSDLNIEDLGFKPISSAPSQFSFYGLGTRLYGRKEVENFNNIYTKILYFTILFVPVMGLGKYLVQQHEGNEYILGKGKLSGFSKGWNLLLVAAVALSVSFFYYQNHVNTPEYIAKSLYQEAIESIEEKDYQLAVKNLSQVYHSQTSMVGKAESKLRELIKPQNLKHNTAEEVLAIMKGVSPLKNLLTDGLGRYIDYFEKYKINSPLVASEFADLIVNASQDEPEIQFYNTQNHQILTKMFKQDSTNLSVATRYALLEERLNACTQCINILAVHKDELGISEAARILGQAYAANYQVDLAYELLTPYVEEKIGIYHQAEQAYNDALNSVWDETITLLNNGKASQSFYDEYDAADKQRQGQLVDEFYAKRRDASVKISDAKDAYIDSASVVPVVLDLGIVLLNRALTITDQNEREASLKKAEETFLSVKSYAGDSDDYQLHLAQVYYWLGSEEKGDKLFDALLEKYNRSHQVLNSLSRTLRELGAFSKAKEYALEAYQNASEAKDKSAYAQSIALLTNKLEEKIKWLEKADQTNAYVKADLLTAKGRKAASENNKNKALKMYQQAIKVYETIPEDATQLNNIALIYISKYRVAFQQQDFTKALEKMDKAVALVPEDSIVLNNAAYQHLEKAYTDILSPYIDFVSLEVSPSLSYFSYLYEDQAKKDEFIDKLAKHSSYKKALGYMQKAMLLAPKNVEILDDLYSLYNFMDSEEEIKQLATRFEKIELDLQQQANDISDFRNGINKEKNLRELERYLTDLKANIRKPVNVKHKTNNIILSSTLIATQLRKLAYGKVVEHEEIEALARANLKVNRSSSNVGDLEIALVHKLLVKGAKKLPDLAKFLDEYRIIFDETSLLAIALGSDEAFNRFVMASSEKIELEQLIAEGIKNFPDNPSILNWKILSSFNNPKAEEIKKSFAANPIENQKDSLLFKRTAHQEYILFYKLLKLEMNGYKDKAKKLNDDAIAKGILIPDFGY